MGRRERRDSSSFWNRNEEMGEADGCFAGLFHLTWGWGVAVISRKKNHLRVCGNRDTAVLLYPTNRISSFWSCGTRLVPLHISHPKGLSTLPKIPREALTQTKGCAALAVLRAHSRATFSILVWETM